MKQKKLLSLGIALLLGLSQLFAQKKSPPLTFKSGDWFEAGIRIRNVARKSDYNFNVKYEVASKAIVNGHLAFKVTIERMRLKYADEENTWLGYDSYYPRYLENRKKNLTKQIYEITADSHGKISNLKVLSTTQKFNFSLISVKTNAPVPKEEFSSETIFPALQVKKISETIISSLISGRAMPKMLPLSNANDIANAVLKSASFTLQTNAVIKGQISNLSAIDTIYAVDKNIFKFNKDGSFSADVLAGLNSRRRWVFGQFDDYKTFSVHLEPLDTLIVKADRLDFENTLSFSGNAAAKAGLSKELVPVFNSQWVNESKYRDKSLEEFLSFQKKGQKEFDDIINKYANRVSSEILDENIINFKVAQAGTKLEFFTHNRSGLKPKMSLEEFPKDFFVSIDTLPVSMSGLEGGLYYIWYMDWLLSYKQTKLGMTNANQYGFYADYATAMASFNGYPLHFSIYNSLRDELHKSEVESTERLKNYYEDFINNCNDTTFTNRIKEQWTKARLWAPGNPSPIKQLVLQDGTTLDFAKFKGKPLVLIVNNNDPDVLKDHIALIKKQNGSQVHFVIAQRLFSNKQSSIEQTLKDLPSVTYVELSNDANNQMNFDLYSKQTKVFTFTSELKVISSYLIDAYWNIGSVSEDPIKDNEIMQEMIKNAIDSSVMTREQKASLINTIGWSAGSILFTFLFIFFINRGRIASIRKKEAVVRQIKELEIKAIRSQMNPHFMFNALNSIQSLINNQQYKQANIYLEKFSVLMRRVLNNSEKSFVPLSDELEALTLYCELEKLRFDFEFTIHIDAGINTDLTEIPGMIIQPLVENSIVHGLAQKGSAGQLNVRITTDQSYLTIEVRDNGTGLSPRPENDQGFGLKLVRERLDLLNAGGANGKLTLSSNLGPGENGTTAVLIIPID